MSRLLNAYATPTLVTPAELAGGTAVIIDVLRASTTIVHALQAGAREVIPCLEVEEALALAQEQPDDQVVLGGERGGLRIEGFDLGNSPSEYTPETVGGKTLVFTTTNGTRAMLHARQARRILIGSFVNATAVFQRLVEEEQVHLICAGTAGQISHDDVLFAGMLATRLQRQGGLPCQENAQAIIARETWLHAFALPQALGGEPLGAERLARELRKSLGARNLVAVGLDEDILTASEVDRFDAVPVFDPASMRIQLS